MLLLLALRLFCCKLLPCPPVDYFTGIHISCRHHMNVYSMYILHSSIHLNVITCTLHLCIYTCGLCHTHSHPMSHTFTFDEPITLMCIHIHITPLYIHLCMMIHAFTSHVTRIHTPSISPLPTCHGHLVYTLV